MIKLIDQQEYFKRPGVSMMRPTSSRIVWVNKTKVDNIRSYRLVSRALRNEILTTANKIVVYRLRPR